MRADETIALAALIQALVAFLIKLHRGNRSWRLYRPALIQENKWRAERYGIHARLIDLGKEIEVAVPDLIHEMIDMLAEEIDELDSTKEIAYIKEILRQGTGADRQLQVWEETRDLKAMVDFIIEETEVGLDL